MNVLVDTQNLVATYTTKKAPLTSGAFLVQVKQTILGKSYDLSVAFVGKDKMREINKSNRNIDKATDILSFPIEKNVGEIYICMDKVVRKSKKFGTTPKKYLEYLFVHGMIHLLGHDHGSKMDTLEKKYTKKLNIYYPYQVY